MVTEVVMQTWSHWAGGVEPGMGIDQVLELRAGAPMGPHSITGPIEVRGAAPGDVLRIDVDELVPGPWGFNLALPHPHGRGVLADRFPDGHLRHLRLDRATMTTEVLAGIRPAPGPVPGDHGRGPARRRPTLVGAPRAVRRQPRPEGPRGRLVAVPAGLPPGAGFYAGDAHAAQGDGEVNQTAIETSMERAALTLWCVGAGQQPFVADLPALPWAETGTHLVTVGLDEDLDEAVRQAVGSLVTHLTARFAIAADDAYALASLAADVEVTQAVNRVKGAHARLAWAAIGLHGRPGSGGPDGAGAR